MIYKNKKLSNYQLKIKNEKILFDCIKWLKENSKTNSDGKWSVVWSLQSMVIDELLFDNLIFSEDIPENEKHKIIRLAINRWWKYKKYRESNKPVNGFCDAVLYVFG